LHRIRLLSGKLRLVSGLSLGAWRGAGQQCCCAASMAVNSADHNISKATTASIGPMGKSSIIAARQICRMYSRTSLLPK
jgi:hypothetical protein